MKSTSTVLLASALFSAATVLASTMSSEGCYSSTAGMVLNATYTYNSIGKCGGACLTLNYVTFATHQTDCYCGQELPPASTSIDNSTCSYTCPGFPSDICGGANAFSLYLTGLSTVVTNASPSETSTAASQNTPSSTTSASPSVVTVGGQTVVVTAPAQATTSSSSASSKSGPSKAGIAAGVVVGLVAFTALGGGVYLFMRHKQRRAIEEEHRRQAAVNSFVGGGKPPGSSGGYSFTDTRLDPAVMAQRRMSDGSIADNQDYSRRILKVTNA